MKDDSTLLVLGFFNATTAAYSVLAGWPRILSAVFIGIYLAALLVRVGER